MNLNHTLVALAWTHIEITTILLSITIEQRAFWIVISSVSEIYNFFFEVNDFFLFVIQLNQYLRIFTLLKFSNAMAIRSWIIITLADLKTIQRNRSECNASRIIRLGVLKEAQYVFFWVEKRSSNQISNLTIQAE